MQGLQAGLDEPVFCVLLLLPGDEPAGRTLRERGADDTGPTACQAARVSTAEASISKLTTP